MLSPDIVYRIDSNNRIASIDGPWDAFATTNNSPHLRARSVLGKPLFGFITGPDTRQLYDVMIQRARDGRVLTRPFRCDGPGVRRDMELTISGSADEMVEFRVRTMQTSPRARHPMLDPHHPRSHSLMRICSWCKQVEVDGRWMDIDVAVRRLSLFDTGPLPRLTHAMCPACFHGLSGDWNGTAADVSPE